MTYASIAEMSSIFTATILAVITMPCAAYIPLNLLPKISHLESIISSNAIITSFTNNLRKEITVERLIFQLFDINLNNHTMYIFTTLLLVSAYGQWKYYDAINSSNKFEKFRKINTYSQLEKTTKEILFLIAFLFIKDVQPAY